MAPQYRRRGIGRRLLGEALARASGRGTKHGWLEVRASNQGALDFYRAAGFAQAGQRRRYYRELVEDAVVCVRRLAAVAAGTP